MINKIDKNAIRRRKHVRVRNKISGTPTRPRLCVFRSNKHISAQIIDDEAGKTLVSASTLDKEVKASIANGSNKDAAAAVGKKIAERALAANIEEVVFDRGGYIFHGRVAALAEAAREAGLKF
ncbi:MAG: 50S ribosomal protein L18 [Clostridiales bacterium]|nr:50S ribosomal protein L18 [Candidatus Scatonaster coprocaballi]